MTPRASLLVVCALALSLSFLASAADPILVQSILPGPTSASQTVVQLQGRDAITVVYNAAVIALGSDFAAEIPSNLVPFTFNGANVPGKIRWVTTSIARFDPDIDWPSDLDFTVDVAPLTSFEGRVVTPKSQQYQTAAQSMYISSITSERASNLTSGTWSPTMRHILPSTGVSIRNGWECPPDGKIQISFSYPINVSLVAAAIQIRSPSNAAIPFTSGPCGTFASANCIEIIPQANSLSVDTQYRLVLPSGSKTYTFGGVTKSDLSLSFYGLYSFTFPFNEYQYPVNSRVLRLYLRHGLSDNSSATLTSFENAFSISPPVPKTRFARVGLPGIEIEYTLEPLINYTLTVTGTSLVRDGFGLPLESQTYTFPTAKPVSFVDVPSDSLAQFESFAGSEWVVLSRNPNQESRCTIAPHVDVVSVDKSNIVNAIASSLNAMNSYVSGTPYAIPTTTVGDFDTVIIPASALFQTSGLFFQESWASCFNNVLTKSSSFIQRSNIGTSILSFEDQAAIWVTDLASNTPISGATVTFYGYSTSVYNPSPASFSALGTGTTNGDGVYTFKLPTANVAYNLIALVESGGLLHLSSTITLNTYSRSVYTNYQSEMIIDKGFHTPGEKLYVKGYVRSVNSVTGAKAAPVNANPATLGITWKTSDPSQTTYPVTISPEGTFSAAITVPSDATYGDNFIALNSQNLGSLGMRTILIANPRIPTTNLNVTALAKIVKPGKPVHVDIKVGTYTGQGVGNAQVTLKWSVKRARPNFWLPDFFYGMKAIMPVPTNTPADESGVMTVTVGADGTLLNHAINVNPLLKSPMEEGNTFTLTAEYFSLTKELVSQTVTLNVALSELQLSLKPTSQGTLLPGINYGLFVGLQDVTEDMEVLGHDVTVALFPWDGVTNPTPNPATGVITPVMPSIENCAFQTVGSGKNSGCEFKLPGFGKFLLIASTLDASGFTVNAVLTLGQTEAEWKANPLARLNAIAFVLDKDNYAVGDVATVSFVNPFAQSRVLVRFGKSWADSTIRVSEGTNGISEIALPVPASCLGGCSVNVFVTAPRGASLSLPVPVPTSILFDVTNPAFQSGTLTLNVPVPVKKLAVNVRLDKAIVEPGKHAGFTVEVKNDQGAPTDAEVAVFVVNKAVLDLMPVPMTDATSLLTRQDPSYFSPTITNSRHFLALESGYNASRTIIERRLRRNPWLNPVWRLYPGDNYYYYSPVFDVDIPDEEFFRQTAATLTEFPYSLYYNQFSPIFMSDSGSVGGMFPGAPPPPPPTAGGPRESEAIDSPKARGPSGRTSVGVRSNFVNTPLFIGKLAVPASGSAWVNWTLPDNIGTFEIRAYALKADTFGSAKVDQISRRTLSLQSAAPRTVRTGDRFLSGVTVTVHDPTFTGEVQVGVAHVCEILQLEGPAIQTVTVSSTAPVLVNFQFLAIGTGRAFHLFTANLSNVVVDAALYPQNVFGQQEPVYVATSFAITEASAANQGFQLPPAVNYSGVLNVDAGVGRLPSVLGLAKIALDQVRATSEPSSYALLAAMSPRIALTPYSGASLDGAASAFSDAITRLPAYTHPSSGLQFSTRWGNYPYTSVRLQAFAIHVFKAASTLSLSTAESSLVQSLPVQWRAALDNQIIYEAQMARQWNSLYSNFDDLAFVFLGLGCAWTPSGASPQELTDLSLSRLLDNTASLSVAGKAALVLALYRDQTSLTRADTLLLELTNAMRVQGRTAYLAWTAGGQNPSFLGSAIALSAYALRRDPNSVLIEKLANFNAQQDVSERRYFSSEQLHHLLVSLGAYDAWKGNTAPSLSFTVANAGASLLSGTFSSAAQLPLKKSFLFEELQAPASPISFSAQGTGEVSVVFGTEFVPAEVSTSAIYRGIQVKKVIQKLDPATNKATGAPLTGASAGDLVVVTIEITLPDYSAAIDIVDPITGAMDALDDNIYSTPSSSPSSPPSPGGFGGGYRIFNYWSWYMLSAFSQKEFLADKVIFHGQNLWAGTHSVSYTALVNTDGEFVLPPAKAFDTFQPELMGLSAGGSFVTKTLWRPSTAGSLCLPWVKRELVTSDLPSWVPTDPDNSGPNGPLVPDPISGSSSGLSERQKIALGVAVPVSILVLVGVVVAAVKLIAIKKANDAAGVKQTEDYTEVTPESDA